MRGMVLRPMVASDAAVLASWAVDPLFCAHAGWRVHSTPDGADSWWRESIARADPALVRLLAVHDGDPVGYVDLYGESPDDRELGFVIGPSARWHQGLGTEAARAGLFYGFTALGLSRIWAEALEANLRSMRILRRVGMRQIGWGDTEAFLGSPSRFARFELLRRDAV